MISRTFSVDHGHEVVGYKGFDKHLETAEIVAVFRDEDVFDCWALDDELCALDELLRYIENETPWVDAKTLRTYKFSAAFQQVKF